MKYITLIFLALLHFSCREENSENLVWSDEFEKDGMPDLTKWGYDQGDHGWGNKELQLYSKENPSNARVEDGRLIIEAHRDSTTDKGYTSARLVTKEKASWLYGYFEVKAKIPFGVGTWPAIWMLPEKDSYGSWPKSGEIDIMEHVGYDPGTIHGTVHTEAFNHVKKTQKGATKLSPPFQMNFMCTPSIGRWIKLTSLSTTNFTIP